MLSFFKRFWAAALSLAAVAGLYVGALAVHLVWVFWVVVAFAAAIALVTGIGPRVLSYGNSIQKYPQLLVTAGRLQDENGRLVAALRAAEDESERKWDEGLAEGRRQIVGGILAAEAPDVPLLTGIDVATDGSLLLLARWSEGGPQVGARYRVEVKSTGANRGVVEVSVVDPGRGKMVLVVAVSASPVFWKHLGERAGFDSQPPNDVQLLPEVVGLEDTALVDRTDFSNAPSTAISEARP